MDAARFAAIVESSFDAIVSKSLEGIVETWNPAAERLFGWTADEMIGQPIRRIIPEDLQEEEDRIIARIRAGATVPKFNTTRLTKAGELLPIAVTVSPVCDVDGKVVGASKVANDLREQVRLEADIREKTEQFTALANNIPQLAWLADGDGTIYWYNQRWFDYTGTTPDEMRDGGWRKVHHPDHVERVVEKIEEAWASGDLWEDTFPLRRFDGKYRWFLSRANPLRDKSGQITLWCGTNTDITDELEAKNRIALLMREVNHRSRNMLATIMAMLNRSKHLSRGELAEALNRRIIALASNQEILNGGDWSGARLVDVLSAQITHLDDELRSRIRLSGPDELVLRASQAEALGLAVHELATNAEKYGALSTASGNVSIDWKVADTADDDKVIEISWIESDGPEVVAPTQAGFGTLLIKRNIEQVFRGAVVLNYEQRGLEWKVRAPAEQCVQTEIVRVDPQTFL